MRIDEILTATRPCFSVEFFPPKSKEGRATLFETVEVLRELEPAYFSVTYGAGGATRKGTLETTRAIRDEYGVEAMAHLSCVGETTESLREIIDRIADAGIENILALRGDPPRGQPDFVQPEGGLASAAELTGLISQTHPEIAIGGACFPEVHPEAPSLEADIAYLKTKVEGGASFLITQLFFDNRSYFDFVPAARAAGIEVPIIAGVMPMTGYKQIARICELCDAKIPDGPGHGDGGARRRRAGGVRARRRLRGTAMRGAARRRRSGNPLLRAQQVAGDTGDPRGAAGGAPLGARLGRDRRDRLTLGWTGCADA